MIGAVGWTGQWTLSIRRDADRDVALQAGQQFTRFHLRPGESVRTPRIVLVLWGGSDPLAGHNALRRLLLDQYVPRVGGDAAVPLVTQLTWFTFHEGNAVTEANQLECMRLMAPMGVEAYWLDAGWFEGGWPAGAGSWVPKKDAFPNGLRPIGDAAREAGLKFVLWFEPERVTPQSRIMKEHPEWVLRDGPGDGLFNVGDPAAREWLTDFLSKRIADWGIDVYRNDFNIDPLRFWQKADAPDRQGITENRYIEGLYAMWDELRQRHPDLVIDNCASGGRRIDLEMIARSVPLWRSDTQGLAGRPLPMQDQVQTAGLSLWTPLHAAGVWSFDPYPWRSVATTGTNLCMDTRKSECPVDLARRAIGETKALRPLWLGDFYPLLPIVLDERQWAGWQCHRADTGKGFAVFFRREQSPYAALDVTLRGMDADEEYDVTFVDTGAKRTMTGAALAKLRVEVASAPGSSLIMYEKRGSSRP